MSSLMQVWLVNSPRHCLSLVKGWHKDNKLAILEGKRVFQQDTPWFYWGTFYCAWFTSYSNIFSLLNKLFSNELYLTILINLLSKEVAVTHASILKLSLSCQLKNWKNVYTSGPHTCTLPWIRTALLLSGLEIVSLLITFLTAKVTYFWNTKQQNWGKIIK